MDDDDDKMTTSAFLFHMTSPLIALTKIVQHCHSIIPYKFCVPHKLVDFNQALSLTLIFAFLKQTRKEKEIEDLNMGSIGEEELFDQMVRDYYESESNTPNRIPPIITSYRPQSINMAILQGILLEATDFEKQVLERVLIYIRNMGEPSSLKKWVVKRLQMDDYNASLCKTSCSSTFDRSKVFQYAGDYEYIEVMMNNKGGKPTRIIVDMDFRSQFEVARPTQTYKELITTLPSILVATEERLNKIVSLICSAAKQSLKEKGLHVPPWRKAKYMQPKWFSKNCKRVCVSPNTEMGLQENAEKGTITASTATATCCPFYFS